MLADLRLLLLVLGFRCFPLLHAPPFYFFVIFFVGISGFGYDSLSCLLIWLWFLLFGFSLFGRCDVGFSALSTAFVSCLRLRYMAFATLWSAFWVVLIIVGLVPTSGGLWELVLSFFGSTWACLFRVCCGFVGLTTLFVASLFDLTSRWRSYCLVFDIVWLLDRCSSRSTGTISCQLLLWSTLQA